MKKFYSLAFFAVITNLLLTNSLFGQTNTWDGSSSNNWNTAANWSLNAVPTNAHDVAININATINVDVSPTINSLTISGNANVSFTSSGAARTITIDNTGSSIATGSTLTLNGSTGSGTRSMGLAFTGTNRTMSIAGTLNLSNVDEGSIYNATNSITTVTGTLINSSTLSNANTTRLVISNGGTYQHNLNNVTVPDATWSAGSLLYVTGVTTTALTGLDQSFSDITWNSTAQTVTDMRFNEMTAVRNLKIMSTGTGNIRIAGTAAAATLPTTGSISNFEITGGTFYLSTGANNGVLNVAGNFTMSGGTLSETGTATGSQIVFTKAGTQVFSKTAGTISNDLDFIVNNGSVLDMGTNVLNGSTGTFTLNTTAGIITAHTQGLSTTASTGSIQVTGTKTFPATASYTYNGSSPQVTGNGLPATVANLTINNTSGVTLSQAVAISAMATFTNGILTTGTGNLLTMNAGSSVGGVSNTSFVNGPMAKIGNTAFTFPIGKTGTGYQPVGISAISASTTFTAEYIRASSGAKGGVTSPLQAVSACEHWMLYASSTVGASVTLYWNANSGCGGVGYINGPFPNPFLRIARYNGASSSLWLNASNTNSQDPANSVTAGNMTTTLASAAFTNPTFFTFGTTNTANSPLPVMYANEKAYAKNNGVQIEWSNLTERDLTGYDIERSANGTNFTAISHQQPKNNLNDKADYAEFDAAPLQGTNYYRIKASEISGKIIYSKILRVEIGSTTKLKFTMYPNPVTGNQVTIGLNNVKAGQYTLRVVSATGQDVLKQTITSPGSSMTEAIQLPASVKPGVYTILISGDNFRESKAFVVQ